MDDYPVPRPGPTFDAGGTRLFHLNNDGVKVALGALDEGPGDLRATREGWIIRREPWLAPIAGAGQFDRDPSPQAA